MTSHVASLLFAWVLLNQAGVVAAARRTFAQRYRDGSARAGSGREPITEDHLDDEPVGARGQAGADADIEFPAWREIDVHHREDHVVLLRARRIDVEEGADVAVVLESRRDARRHVVADLRGGREGEARARIVSLQ